MPILLAAVFFIWGATNWYSWTRPPDYDWEKVRKRSIRIVGIVLFLATVVTLFGITINMPMLLSQMTLKRFGFPW